MTAVGTKLALQVIDAELDRLPVGDREKVAEQILGALESVFFMAPKTADPSNASTKGRS